MKILLCAYHEAGYRALRILAQRGHEVLVASHPTPPEFPSVPALASWWGMECVEGRPAEVLEAANRFQPDLILSMYYRHILPEELLNLAPRGALNFHPALLPRHRGCFSAVWAILEGDHDTGVTCHRMVPAVDAGEIVDQVAVPIHSTDTALSLYYRLVDAAVDLFECVVRRSEQAELRGRPQQGEASYHRREVPYGGLIDPSWPRDRIERFIRAMDFPPYPPASVEVDGTRIPVRSLAEFNTVMRRPFVVHGG